MKSKRTICIDFDGVIHAYGEGWKDGSIYDKPVYGAFDFLDRLVADERFEVCIYSSRSKMDGGVVAMQEWLHRHGLDGDTLCGITFPTEKPAAWLTIDDRAFVFRGVWPSVEYLLEYQPWNRSPFKAEADVVDLRRIALDLDREGTDGGSLLRRIANSIEGTAQPE